MTNDKHPTPEDFEDFEDYCAALRRCKWLTPQQYACLLENELVWGEESYAEHYTQYRSECAMFGDAGPGQGLTVQSLGRQLSELRSRINQVRRVISNLSA